MCVAELPSQAVLGGVRDISIAWQAKQFHTVGTDLIP
jgi:hypothetical protein